MSSSILSNPVAVSKVVVRIGFGVALALVGVAHYMDISVFAEAVGRGLDQLEPLGMVWGYILPALMIVGGTFIACGFLPPVGTMLAGIALVSIPAGLMLKSVLSGLSLNDTMPAAMNAIVWILYYVAATQGFGTAAVGVPRAPAAPAKAVPAKPVMVAKAMSKKPVGKKK